MDEVKQCKLKYEDLGRKYMENARKRTKASPWDSYLYGLTLTMTRNSENHPEVLADLHTQVPTVLEARNSCRIGKPGLVSSRLTYDPAQIAQSVCENSREYLLEKPNAKNEPKVIKGGQNWEHLRYTLNQCVLNPTTNLDDVRKGVRQHYTFQQQKGPDMLMLEAGCETPVMDVWMMRYALGVPIAGYTEAEKAAAEVVEEQELPEETTKKKSHSKFAKLKLQAAKPRWEQLKENVLSEDNITDRIRAMQGRAEEYAQAKNQIIKEADSCGVPRGVYHVAKWFELAEVTRDNRKAAEDYLDKLIHAMD